MEVCPERGGLVAETNMFSRTNRKANFLEVSDQTGVTMTYLVSSLLKKDLLVDFEPKPERPAGR